MTTTADTAPGDHDRSFLGHPRGLAYLSFAEGWERFSFYGMQALLVLYMVDQLLLPGHVENVVGFGWALAQLEAMYGPLSVQATASAIFGMYAGGVYLTPILGGLLADRVLGRTRTVILGASLMAAGHFLMAFDQPFLLALLLLVLGCGCFKGNIATQVGALYGPTDLRRADAFQIYYIAINAAVIVAPLVTGTLGEKVGWHWGFGAAGIGMLIGLFIYLSGRSYLPPEPALQRAAGVVVPKLGARELKVLLLLLALLPVLAVAVLPNQQIFNAYLVWAQQNARFTLFGIDLPTTWLITIDAAASLSMLLSTVWFWRRWARTRSEPDELGKIAIGCFISALGALCLFAGAWNAAASGDKVNFLWLVAFHVINSAGFANVFPVALALYARSAPAAVAATIIGIFYLHLFAANNLAGYVGGLLEKMPATDFWLLHAACAAGGCAVFVVVRILFRPLLIRR